MGNSKEAGKDALKYGASGAAIGSAFGPWGTAIGGIGGAAVGGLMGFFSGGGDSAPPGAGGSRANTDTVIRDPLTGELYDPNNGTTYLRPDGNKTDVVTNPNVAQQVAQDHAHQMAFLSQLAQYQQREQQAAGGQIQLANNLAGVINGTAPSVANLQLQQGLGQVAAQQQSEAAGTSGQTAVLARMAAMRNTAQAQQQANQQASVNRAQETATARGQMGTILGNVAQESSGMRAQNLDAATTYAGQEMQGQAAQQNLNFQGQQAQINRDRQDTQAMGAAIGTLAQTYVDDKKKDS